jgi:hypothetical protein
MPAPGSTADIHLLQRSSDYRQVLPQRETFVEPPALIEREQQGLIKAFEPTLELRSQGDATLLGSRDTLREAFRLGRLQAVGLFGSRAMGPALAQNDCLALMAAVADLLLPWRVDLVLRDAP